MVNRVVLSGKTRLRGSTWNAVVDKVVRQAHLVHASSQGPVASGRAGKAYAGDAVHRLAALAQRAQQAQRADLCHCAPEGVPCIMSDCIHLASLALEVLPSSLAAVPPLWD